MGKNNVNKKFTVNLDISTEDAEKKVTASAEKIKSILGRALTDSLGVKEFRDMANTINQMFESIGKNAPLDIEKYFKGNGSAEKRIKLLTDSLNELSNVMNQTKTGSGGNNSGITGDLNKDVQVEIEKLQKQKQELQDILDTINNPEGMSVKLSGKNKEQLEQLKTIKDEYVEARDAKQQFEKSNMTNTSEYLEAVGRYARASAMVKSAFQSEDLTDKNIDFLSTRENINILQESETFIENFHKNFATRIGQMKKIFSDFITNINTELGKIQKTDQPVESSTYDKLKKNLQEYYELKLKLKNVEEDSAEYNNLQDRQRAIQDEIYAMKELSEEQENTFYDLFDSIDAEDNLQLNDALTQFCNILKVDIPNGADQAASAATSAFTQITTAVDQAIDASQKVENAALRIKKAFDMVHDADAEFRITFGGQGLDIRSGLAREIDQKTLVENYLANINQGITLGAHSHRGISSGWSVSDIRQAIESQFSGLSKVDAVFGDRDITSIDFSGVSKEIAYKILDAIEKDSQMKLSGELKASGINRIAKQFGAGDIAKYWDVSEGADDFAKYIYDIEAAAQNAIEPVDRLKNLLTYLKPDIDLSKYDKELNAFANGTSTVADVFNRISKSEGIGTIVDNTNFSSLSDVAAKLTQQQEEYQQKLLDTEITYKEILDMVQQVQDAGTKRSDIENTFGKYFNTKDIRQVMSYFEQMTNPIDIADNIKNLFGFDEYDEVVEMLQSMTATEDSSLSQLQELLNKRRSLMGKLTEEDQAEAEKVNKAIEERINVLEELASKNQNGVVDKSQASNRILDFKTAAADAKTVTTSINQAESKLKEFLALVDEIHNKSFIDAFDATDNVEVGKYTERLNSAKAALDELGDQGQLTAEQLEQINSVFDVATRDLQAQTQTYDGYASNYSHTYDYYDEYQDELEKKESLQAENEQLRAQLADQEANRQQAQDNTYLQETIALLEKERLTYEDVLALVRAYNDETKSKAAATSGDWDAYDKIFQTQSDIARKLVPISMTGMGSDSPDKWLSMVGISAEEAAQKLYELYNRWNAFDDLVDTEGSASDDLDAENASLERKLELLRDIAEQYGNSITQKDRNRYEKLSDKEMESGLTSTDEDRYSELGEKISEADEQLEQFGETYDKILLKLANGKTIEILPEDAGLRKLDKIANEFYQGEYNGFEIEDVVFMRKQEQSVIEQNNQELQKQLDIQEQIATAQKETPESQQAETIANNEKAITSWEELCQVVERYNELVLKAKTEGQTLTNEDEAELSRINDRFAATKGVADDPDKFVDYAMAMSRMSGILGEYNPNRLAKYFGIEIPQAAAKATNAIQEVAQAAEDSSTPPDTSASTAKYEAETQVIKQQNDELERNQQLKVQEGALDTNSSVVGDMSQESKQLDELHSKLVAVKEAADAKTQAFEEEYVTVDAAVNAEVQSLQLLLQQLQDVLTTLGLINQAFTQANESIARLYGTKDIDIKEDAASNAAVEKSKEIINKQYALDSTVASTNKILGDILASINKEKDPGVQKELGTLISALTANINALKDATNGVIDHQKAQKTDTTKAMARIQDPEQRQIVSGIAKNSVEDLGTEAEIESLQALANGLVKVEGAFKNANGQWEGFTVKVNEHNKAVDLAIKKHSTFANMLNNPRKANGEDNPYQYSKEEVETRAQKHLDELRAQGKNATVQFKDSGRYTITILEEIDGLSKQIFQTFDENDKKIERTTVTMSNSQKEKLDRLQRQLIDNGVTNGLISDQDQVYNDYQKASDALDNMTSAYSQMDSLSDEQIEKWKQQIVLVQQLGGQVEALVKQRGKDNEAKIFKSDRTKKLSKFDLDKAELQKNIAIPDSFNGRMDDARSAIENATDSDALKIAINNWEALKNEIKATATQQDLYIKKTKETKKTAPKQDTFTGKLATQKTDFAQYKQDVENATGVTDELKGKLVELENQLNSVGDADGLAKWAKSFKSVADEIKSSREKIATEIVGKANSKFREVDFKDNSNNLTSEQQAIVDKRKELLEQIDEYNTKVRSGQNAEISGIEATRDALYQLIDAYKTKYNIENAGGSTTKKAYGTAQLQNFTGKYNSLMNRASSVELDSDFEAVQKLTAAYQHLQDVQAKFKVGEDTKSGVGAQKAEEFKQAQIECNRYAQELAKIITAEEQLRTNSNSSGGKSAPVAEDFDDSMKGRAQALEDFVRVAYGANASIGKLNDDMTELSFVVKNGDGTITNMTASLNAARTAIYATAGGTEKATTSFGKFFDELKGKARGITTYLISMTGFQEIWQQVRQGVQYVREIDSALTELRKVTNETEASYKQFLQTASKTAGVIGSNVADFTNATADFARLGYNLEEAANLAKTASVYKNVGDGIEDISQASESIISTMKAFGIEADNAMGIVDRFNAVGNSFAISSTGIGEAMQRSASALFEAGNTIDESIALITGANSVVQNPEQVGKMLADYKVA